jgi:hypothetical protein
LTSARDKIEEFFLKNVGRVVETKVIEKVAGISDYQRRIRELRNECGLEIKSHVDRADLKPGQYILETTKRKPVVGRGISPQLRAEILERNGYTCQQCGAGPLDPDAFNPSRKVRLHIDHMKPQSHSGPPKKENLRVLCNACNQGRSNIETPAEDAINILGRLRRTSREVRHQVYTALHREFDSAE